MRLREGKVEVAGYHGRVELFLRQEPCVDSDAHSLQALTDVVLDVFERLLSVKDLVEKLWMIEYGLENLCRHLHLIEKFIDLVVGVCAIEQVQLRLCPEERM